jgi:exosortase/archaeosortase family protein
MVQKYKSKIRRKMEAANIKHGGAIEKAYATMGKEKPLFHHAAIQVSLAIIFALFLTSSQAWDLIARICTNVLNFAGIRTQCVSSSSLVYVRLLDGMVVGFKVLVECSGLITLLVFTFISCFTIGLLKGALTRKLIWFVLSVAVGFAWNINRLTLVIAVAYYCGLPAFSFIHYVLAPTIDFVWIVSLWAVGMSWLKREESA